MEENPWLKNQYFLLKIIRKSPEHNGRKHGFVLFHNNLFFIFYYCHIEVCSFK